MSTNNQEQTAFTPDAMRKLLPLITSNEAQKTLCSPDVVGRSCGVKEILILFANSANVLLLVGSEIQKSDENAWIVVHRNYRQELLRLKNKNDDVATVYFKYTETVGETVMSTVMIAYNPLHGFYYDMRIDDNFSLVVEQED